MSSDSKIQYYSLQGISCAGCVRSVDKALNQLQQQQPTLESYSINFADRTAVFSGQLASNIVIGAIQQAGYDATLLSSEQDREAIEAKEQQHLKQTLLKSMLALLSGGLMMLVQMLGAFAPLSESLGLWQGYFLALVSAAVMYFCAANIYRGAWQSLKTRSFNMDILIALGTLSAWSYSIIILSLLTISEHWVPKAAQHLYFEAASMILGFILLGQALEAKVRGSTAKAVQSLVNLQPKLAWRKTREGQFEQVPAPLLVPGDIVLIKPAESIPMDGEVVDGQSVVDESMISGESLGIAKNIGDLLIGSTLNGNGSLIMKVSQVGDKTVLSQIISQVRQAQNSKPALGRLADEIAAVFVPAVLLIALLTALIWWWFVPQGEWSLVLSATMTVLIIACPCALGLATPMSTMVGVGLAASKGVLIQNGDALQVAEKLTTVVLDKTGTITQGKPKVTDVLWLNQDRNKHEFFRALALVEQRSEHPLAHAVYQYSNNQLQSAHDVNSKDLSNDEMALKNFDSHTGLGISARVNAQEIKVGSLNWLGSQLTAETLQKSEQWMAQAKSVVLIEVAGETCLMLAIADAIKDDSIQAITELKKQGLQVLILSGDKEQSVAAVAKQVAIDRYYAELSPAQKLEKIKELQANGEVVAMVGDGVNDSPALALSDLGCAIGSGSDVAINNADITLIRGSLATLNAAIKVSRLTMRNIKQNLFAAFAYNIVAIPIAAGVLYPFLGILLNPMIAGGAMALSSITVVSNAYRLRRKLDSL
jgi:Cu+-exporting ATPase